MSELLKKEQMTEGEARELEEKNQALKAQMILFEEKTKRIQLILGKDTFLDIRLLDGKMIRKCLGFLLIKTLSYYHILYLSFAFRPS